MRILPHRYPFLLVDRVIDIKEGKSATGIKNVTANEIFFNGHFPTKPVMPGVLMVEAIAQTAGITILIDERRRDMIAFFMAIDNVKFRRVVEPGDQLVMKVTVIKDKLRTVQVKGVATVDGKIVVEGDMMFSFVNRSYLDI